MFIKCTDDFVWDSVFTKELQLQLVCTHMCVIFATDTNSPQCPTCDCMYFLMEVVSVLLNYIWDTGLLSWEASLTTWIWRSHN